MSIVKFITHEMATSFEERILSRFARREVDRLAFLGATQHHNGPHSSSPDAADVYTSGRVLSGLEVAYVSGSTVMIGFGALVTTNPSPITETRPVTQSGAVEPDDYFKGIYVQPLVSGFPTVAPAVPISSALPAREWWLVHCSPIVADVETNTGRLVFNEGTGEYDTTSDVKVEQHRLSFGVVRGTAGGTIPALPSGATALAHILVPTGATDLSSATIFDVRYLPDEDPGPNEVTGQWECPLVAGWSDPDDIVWQGEVSARIGGERLRVSARQGLKRASLLEPGATWPAGFAICWLYLCKVRGKVPRPVRVGAAAFSYGAARFDDYVARGALVLSPTPPKGGILDTTGRTGGLWDLRPSASLTLPDSESASTLTLYPYNGETVTADEAICVGFLVSSFLISSKPALLGPLYCDERGWVSGDGLTPHDFTDLLLTLTNGSTGGASIGVTGTPQLVSIGGSNTHLPIEGVRASVRGTVSAGGGLVTWKGRDTKRSRYVIESGSDHAFDHETSCEFVPGSASFVAAAVSISGATFSTISSLVTALKLPYGKAVLT